MEAPDLLRADSDSSTLAPGDEIRPGDLPVGANQRQENSDTTQPEVAVIIESEVGRLGKPALLAEGTAFGEISPSAAGDQSVESGPVYEADTPTFEVTSGGALLDGVSKPDESMGAPFFIPRGRKDLPAVTYDSDEDGKRKKNKKKDVDPKKNSKNSSDTKDTKQTKDAKPAKK